jgi:putative PIN family toxin of toxin-antitoxin system
VLRVVLDPGVLVSGFSTAEGPPGRLVDLWRRGEFDLVVSDALLEELQDVLQRPHLAARVDEREARAYVAGLRRGAIAADDPPNEPGLTPDPGDDYLVALARAARADLIVSGDAHLTRLVGATPPVLTPRAFAAMLVPDA